MFRILLLSLITGFFFTMLILVIISSNIFLLFLFFCTFVKILDIYLHKYETIFVLFTLVMNTKTFYIVDEISNLEPDCISSSKSFSNWSSASRYLMTRLPFVRSCYVKRICRVV